MPMSGNIFSADLGQEGQNAFAKTQSNPGLALEGEAQAAATRGKAVATEITNESYKSLGQGFAAAGQAALEGAQTKAKSDLYNQYNAMEQGLEMEKKGDAFTQQALSNPGMRAAYEELQEIKKLRDQGHTNAAAVALRASAILKHYTNAMPGFTPELTRLADDVLGFRVAGAELKELMGSNAEKSPEQKAKDSYDEKVYNTALSIGHGIVTPESMNQARQNMAIIAAGEAASQKGHINTLMSNEFNSESIMAIDHNISNMLIQPTNPNDPKSSSFLQGLVEKELAGGLDSKSETMINGQLNQLRENYKSQYMTNMQKEAMKSGFTPDPRLLDEAGKHIDQRFNEIQGMIKDGSMVKITKEMQNNLDQTTLLKLSQNPKFLEMMVMEKSGIMGFVKNVQQLSGDQGSAIARQLGVSKDKLYDLMLDSEKSMFSGQVIKGNLPASQTANYNAAIGILQSNEQLKAGIKTTAFKTALTNGSTEHMLQSAATPELQQAIRNDPEVRQAFQSFFSNQLSGTEQELRQVVAEAKSKGMTTSFDQQGNLHIEASKDSFGNPSDPRAEAERLQDQAGSLNNRLQMLLQAGGQHQDALGIKSIPEWQKKEIDSLTEVGQSTNPKGQISGNNSVEKSATLLRNFEGFSSTPYWDVNHYRTGFGSDTITTAEGKVIEVKPGMSVTKEDAERDLQRRIGEFQGGIQKQIGEDQWNKLNDNVKAALTSVAYNYGSLPKNVAEAVKTGDQKAIAEAIAERQNDNHGINRSRRLQEAQMITQFMPGEELPKAQDEVSKVVEASTKEGAKPADLAEAYLGSTAHGSKDALTSFFNKSLGQKVDPTETPWCAAFVNSIIQAGGGKGTGSLAAMSFLNYGEESKNPSRGDIVVFQWPNGEHHVAILESMEGDKVKVVGGNQRSGGGEHGVTIASYSKSSIIGIRKPPSIGEMKKIVESQSEKNTILP